MVDECSNRLLHSVFPSLLLPRCPFLPPSHSNLVLTRQPYPWLLRCTAIGPHPPVWHSSASTPRAEPNEEDRHAAAKRRTLQNGEKEAKLFTRLRLHSPVWLGVRVRHPRRRFHSAKYFRHLVWQITQESDCSAPHVDVPRFQWSDHVAETWFRHFSS